MKLYEFQAKQVFASAGLPIPSGEVASTPAEARAIAARLGRVVVKAQVHVGGRGKAGGIKLAETPEEAERVAEGMLGKPLKGFLVQRVLVEQALDIASEYYASVTVDRDHQSLVMITSRMGGIDIEEVAASHAEEICKVRIDPTYGLSDYQVRQAIYGARLDSTYARQLAGVLRQLYGVFVGFDASLTEINPLVISGDGKVLAADAKFDVDDNALFRQKELARYQSASEEDPLEAEAHRRGLTYVHLGGNIGVIGNGAGLVMTTLDLINREGGKPANFLDIGGGARAEVVRNALEMVLLDPNVKGIFLNIFGGITRCDEVAKGILEAAGEIDLKVPIVGRMAGTAEAEGRALLQGSVVIPEASASAAARRIVQLVKG